MKLITTAVLILLTPFSLAGGPADDVPKSPQAVDAQAKHDAVVKKAAQAYHDAEVSADAQLITDLNSAMNAALANKNVDEVKRIDAAKNKAKAAMRAVDAGAAHSSSEWLANTEWLHSDGYGHIKYSENGEVTCSTWSRPGRWEAIDSETIRQIEPSATVVIYFTADHRHALWMYQGTRHSEIAASSRQ